MEDYRFFFFLFLFVGILGLNNAIFKGLPKFNRVGLGALGVAALLISAAIYFYELR